MVCPKCGNNNEDGYKFCSKCGMVLNNQTQNVALPVQNNQAPVQVQNTPAPAPVKKKKKHVFLKILIILAIVIGGIVLAIKLLNKKSNNEDALTFEKEYQYLMTDSSNNYIIKHAPKDIAFFVTSDSDYEVLDEKGNKVNVVCEKNKIYSKSGYEEGKTYTITLKSGQFVSSELGDTKKVTFTIERKESNVYEFNSKNKFTTDVSVTETADKITLTSKNKYNVGDIIVVGNKEDFDKAYYVTEVNGSNYTVRDAKLDEIYSKLDVYKEEVVDLSNYHNDEAIKDYLVEDVKTSDWYLGLIEEVEAEPKIEVNIKNIENGIEAKLTVTVKPSENSKFFNSKYHEMSFILTEKLSMTAVYDITLTNWDVSYDIVNKSEFKIKVNNTSANYKDVLNNKVTKEILEGLKNKANGQYEDNYNGTAPLTKIVIPTKVPGLDVNIELSLVQSLKATVSLEASTGVTRNITVGFDAGIGEDFKPLYSFLTQDDKSDIKLVGDMTYKLGLNLAIGVDFINTFEVSFNAEGGYYQKGKFTLGYNTDSGFSGEMFFDSGLYVKLYLKGKALNKTLNFTLLDKEVSLVSDTIPLLFKDKEDGTMEAVDPESNKSLDTNSHTYEDLNEANSCVLRDGNDYEKVKFNLKNGELKGATITVKITVDTGNEGLDNFVKFLLQIYTIMLDVEYRSIGYSYSEGKDVYMVFHLSSKSLMRSEGVETDSYIDVKSSFINAGYTCN